MNPNGVMTYSPCRYCKTVRPETDFNRKRYGEQCRAWRDMCFGCVCIRLLDQMLPTDKPVKVRKPRRKPMAKKIVMECLSAPIKKKLVW